MDAVILAAGSGKRYGGNKLLQPVDNKPLYRNILEHCVALQQTGQLRHVICVTQWEEIARDMEAHGVLVVENHAPELGISRSIRLGLAALETLNDTSESCLFAVSDQPYLTLATMEGLIAAFESGTQSMALCAHGKQMGNPVIFRRQHYAALRQLQGDRGGKSVVRKYPQEVLYYPVNPRELEDLDVAIYQLTQGDVVAVSPQTAFPFLYAERLTLTLVGAGGKTTLLYFLAEQFALSGRKTLVTTTTHIRKPTQWVATPEQVQQRWAKGQYAVVGTPVPQEKLCALPPAAYQSFCHLADVVLIEGDGAKECPCKAPATDEPVIAPESDVVVAVVGYSAVGKPIEKSCFRSDLVATLLGKSTAEVLTSDDLVTLLTHGQGGRKHVGARSYYAVVNQWDTPDAAGTSMLQSLHEKGVGQCALTHFTQEEKETT